MKTVTRSCTKRNTKLEGADATGSGDVVNESNLAAWTAMLFDAADLPIDLGLVLTVCGGGECPVPA